MLENLKNATLICCEEKLIAKKINVKIDENKLYFENVAPNNENSNYIILPKFVCFNIEKQNNLFNLENLSEENLIEQLNNFKNENVEPLFYINDIIKLDNYYDIIVPFCVKNKIKICVKFAETLNELGEFDKIYGESPIDFLEEVGILDTEPTIFSCANLDKEDLEKLSFYNVTICLNLSEDLLKGNGLAKILTMKKYNLKICLNSFVDDVFKEMFLCCALTNGVMNLENAIQLTDVVSIAVNPFNKKISFENVVDKKDFVILKIEHNLKNVFENIVLKGGLETIKNF